MLLNTTTGERVSEHAFKALHPNTSFPDRLTDAALSPFGFATLTTPPHPPCAPGQKVVDAGNVQVGADWFVQWQAVDMTAQDASVWALERKRMLTAQVQSHIDAEAVRRGYESILSAATYADDPTVPAFQADGIALRGWRSAVWAHCFNVFTQVDAGQIPMPCDAELLATLPLAPQL